MMNSYLNEDFISPNAQAKTNKKKGPLKKKKKISFPCMHQQQTRHCKNGKEICVLCICITCSNRSVTLSLYLITNIQNKQHRTLIILVQIKAVRGRYSTLSEADKPFISLQAQHHPSAPHTSTQRNTQSARMGVCVHVCVCDKERANAGVHCRAVKVKALYCPPQQLILPAALF